MTVFTYKLTYAVNEAQIPPDFDETYVEWYTQDEGVLCSKKCLYRLYTLMGYDVLHGVQLNDGQDNQILLSTAEVTVSSPTMVTTSSSSTTVTSFSTTASTITVATSSRDDTQDKRKVMVNTQLTNILCYH